MVSLWTRSNHRIKVQKADNPVIDFSHFADAAIFRRRGTCVVATQHVSPFQPFKSVVLGRTETVLSLHVVWTRKTRDKTDLGFLAFASAASLYTRGEILATLQPKSRQRSLPASLEVLIQTELSLTCKHTNNGMLSPANYEIKQRKMNGADV